MRAHAAVVEVPGAPFTIREVDIAPPAGREVLVRVTACGICRSDLTYRHVWPRARTPVVLGHEGTGTVERVGPEVSRVEPGDTVCMSYLGCGTCARCSAGHPAYCDSAGRLNLSGTRPDGTTPLSHGDTPVYGAFFGQSSFATHALAHENNTVPVPSEVPPWIAAPLGCGVQTGVGAVFNLIDPRPEDSLVVFGAGGVGLSAVMAAVALGCERVVAVDPVSARRALASELGAHATVDPGTGADVPAEVRRAVGGGAHHALDTTGLGDAVANAVASLRTMGSLVLAGLGSTAEVDVSAIVTRGISIRGTVEGDAVPSGLVPRMVRLYHEGLLPVERIVTEFPFARIEEAARAASDGHVVKPVLRM
ncbi:NAD(P)-dependent alcohol dehydrogenase [Halostreptopolyspora alba]|uniref:NAD(P)-dependent alcohol dehydrogenase n=1 Tax=Halostreptopolyspora alba TaxID=2487137 RepID=A0A3N0E315_9ACTN|nr:NAD(P)-dependent alcohol dehydrogenase [Nocardiopsaceae bacterium YIM 96095]